MASPGPDRPLVITSISPRISRLEDGIEVGPRYQRRCVESWLGAGAHLLSVNPDSELAELRSAFPDVTFRRSEPAPAARPLARAAY